MQDVFEALIAREKLGSTGFGNGIAIPHCRLKGCEAPISALLHLEAPIDFDAIDGAPVDLLFVLLVPEAATDAHLELLRQIASMLDRKEVREKLRSAPATKPVSGCPGRAERSVIMRLIIVSGRSGSGKSTALDVLEDNGYYCIDNLPAGLLPELAERALIHTELAQPLVAVSIDARNLPSHLSRFPNCSKKSAPAHPVRCAVSGCRRRNPAQALLGNPPTPPAEHCQPLAGRSDQRRNALLGPIADLADLKINTTNLNLYQLRDTIKLRLLNQPEPGTAFLVESFGFKRGMPVDADLVFDVRCLPNPTGSRSCAQSGSITGAEYLAAQPDVEEMFRTSSAIC
jgi:UPF0042 nucleotide-binding protein